MGTIFGPGLVALPPLYSRLISVMEFKKGFNTCTTIFKVRLKSLGLRLDLNSEYKI